MPEQSVEITLGDRRFSVPPMNVDQIIEVQGIVSTLEPRKTGKAMLVVALSRAVPTATSEEIGQIMCAPDEIIAAVDKILRHSGFKVADPNAPAPATAGG